VVGAGDGGERTRLKWNDSLIHTFDVQTSPVISGKILQVLSGIRLAWIARSKAKKLFSEKIRRLVVGNRSTPSRE
jgi:hypothetical protein